MESPDRIKHVIDTLQSSETITEWESNFVDSIARQFERNGELSEKQVEVLEDILKRDTLRK